VFEKRRAADEHAKRVREMFATIAGRYDLLNHLLSANVDKRWRKIVAGQLVARIPSEALILDVACGTGDLSQTLFEKTRARVVATDFCRPMLSIAAGKLASDVKLIEGDALKLPFKDGTFDAVTIGFGLRNLADVNEGLRELLRILKPEGWVAVLEFSRPSNVVMRSLFGLYFRNILPRLGGLVSGSVSAYTYLPDSVSKFPDQEQLVSVMREVGFTEVSYQNLTGGIAALHIGKRPR
jgi:demethylmenaquinone methyltransferase/2-methoxy-6-polyprenyl-1,4-benzoquinol methylase